MALADPSLNFESSGQTDLSALAQGGLVNDYYSAD